MGKLTQKVTLNLIGTERVGNEGKEICIPFCFLILCIDIWKCFYLISNTQFNLAQHNNMGHTSFLLFIVVVIVK